MTDQMVGMDAMAISDIDVNPPLVTLRTIGIHESEICVTNKLSEAEDAVRAGKYLVTEDALLLTKLDSLDTIVEATGLTEVGSKVAWNCILQSKHVIMLNVETNFTIGALLHRLAKKSNSVYRVASGDEPGVCKMLYDFASTLGFEMVCLGKDKNNPIGFDASPESCPEEAESKGMKPKTTFAKTAARSPRRGPTDRTSASPFRKGA